MKDEDSMEKHVERKLLIARLMQKAFRESPGSKSEFIWVSEIVRFDPLLAHPNTFLIAVERIRDELGPGFDMNTQSYLGRENDIVVASIDDPKKLDKYIAEKEVELAEVREEASHSAFVLDADAKLYLVDSELPPCPIERGSLRHKLIYYLAKSGGYMSAAQLADKIGSNPKRVRTTVGQLRNKVHKQFDVPGTDLIQSRGTGSYCASTVLLRVPKGYTP